MNQRNIRLLIAFDGTNYCGWQRQENGPTIQGTIESKLLIITKEKCQVNSSGRTDAGVHALGMAANFLTSSTMTAPSFQKALNSMLPRDIRILKTDEVAPDFHARYNSTGKTYRYDIFTGSVQRPEERLYRTHVRCSFNIANTLPCLQKLLGSHDFSSFEAVGSRDRNKKGGMGAVRTLFRADCIADQDRPDHYSFYFTGNGFLRHMVRNLIGTVLLVGAGRMDSDEFTTILDQKDRSIAGPTAPAHGLFLEQVHYDPLITSDSER